MRVIFAGTPEFARTGLESLLAAGIEVVLVLTQPDRPAGRGMKLQASPVKRLALAHGIAFIQPQGLRLDGKFPADAALARAAIEAAGADAMVVAAYGLILPQWVLDLPLLGCLNIHASLLPRWRGAAPIHRAIEAGDGESGVTIMQMDAGLDTGDMLLTRRRAIAATDTTQRLHDRLASIAGALIVDALQQAAAGELDPQPQPTVGVTYAQKIGKAEAVLDWGQPALVLERKIRALDPFPGASTSVGTVPIKLWCSVVDVATEPSGARPGTVLAVDGSGITVACGEGVLRLTELQRAGGKRLAVADFLHGFGILPGTVFGETTG